ncbi:MAG: hypothetical protein EBE86_025490 [Hormoscilla sp. GUM202]|nr:hypothetical protein [Hormoscilla sp. GUM202]
MIAKLIQRGKVQFLRFREEEVCGEVVPLRGIQNSKLKMLLEQGFDPLSGWCITSAALQ